MSLHSINRYVLSLTVALFVTSQLYSQPLLGVYKHKTRHLDEEYWFDSNGGFSWYRRNGADMISGDGTYSFAGTNLTLHFEKAHPRYEVQLSQSQPNADNKTNLRMSAIYTDGIPFTSLKVTLEKTGTSASSNSQGVVDLNLLDAPVNDQLIVEADGVRIYSQPIRLRGYNHFYALVFETKDQYREDVTETLRVIKRRRALLISNGEAMLKFKNVALPLHYTH